jgi:hypothetical protein
MENDYPSAHSMDTCFFAVDRDGHVAIFDTGEAGAVPVIALSGEEADDVRQQLAQLPRVEVLQDPRGHIIPGRGKANHGGLRGSEHPILMFLTSLDHVRHEIAEKRAVQLPATEGIAVLFQTLPEATAQRLHDSGVCLGCEWHFHDEEREEYCPDLAARGLFSYSHLTENWISGPYGRERQPAQPIHVDQLPPRIREAVRSMRFESLCFAATPHIQPVEHTECVSWEAAYMDVAGINIHSIPGKEDEYSQQYRDLADYAGGKNINVEPPPGHNPDAAEE